MRRGSCFRLTGVTSCLARARIEDVEVEFRAQVDAVVEAGLAPTHLDWHCLADGGREDIFELTLALAGEYGLAVRVWGEAGRRKVRGLPVTDNDFLDSFSLGLEGKAARYARLLRELPVGLNEWAVIRVGRRGVAGGRARGWRVRQTDHAFLVSAEARELLREEGIFVIDYRGIQEWWSGRRRPARALVMTGWRGPRREV